MALTMTALTARNNRLFLFFIFAPNTNSYWDTESRLVSEVGISVANPFTLQVATQFIARRALLNEMTFTCTVGKDDIQGFTVPESRPPHHRLI